MGNPKSFDIFQLLSLTFAALALVPGGAHVFELLNKMALPPDQYMTVQGIYRGWALFGIVLFGSLALTCAHAVAVRDNAVAMLLSVLSAVCVLAGLVLFFMFTYPMNVASSNWTVLPPDFESAWRQWEYSHAVNAMLLFIAFVALASSVLRSRQTPTALRTAAE